MQQIILLSKACFRWSCRRLFTARFSAHFSHTLRFSGPALGELIAVAVHAQFATFVQKLLGFQEARESAAYMGHEEQRISKVRVLLTENLQLLSTCLSQTVYGWEVFAPTEEHLSLEIIDSACKRCVVAAQT